jgi:flagellar biosynthesis GTPase FlhF
MRRGILFSSLAFLPLLASAQEIAGVRVSPGRAAVDEPVQITIDFQVGDAPPGCGLKLNLGDGSVRHMRADQTNMPLGFSYRYPRGGEFTILAEGALFVRGLRTALACSGMKKAVVSVVDVAAEREAAARKLESEERQRSEREAAEREASLELERSRREAAAQKAQLEEQERVSGAREAEARAREAEAKRRAADEKERELASRDAELRRREREAGAREARLRALEQEVRREARKTAPPAAAKPAAPGGSARHASRRPEGTLDAF